MATFQEAVNTAQQLYEAGRLPEAERLYLQILGANPTWAQGHIAVSRIFYETDRIDLAIAAMQAAIANHPADLPTAFNNLGVLLHAAKKYSQAADAFRKTVEMVPNYTIAHKNLGDALRQLEQLESAEQSYRHALRLDPAFGDCHVGIGLTYSLRGRYPEAIEQYQLALKLNPGDISACMHLTPSYIRLGDQAAVERTVRRAVELCPDEADQHSALLMFLNYTHGADLPVILTESLEYNRRHVLPLGTAIRPHNNNPDPNRQLRVGFISPDFRVHSVSMFFVPVLCLMDRSRFHISCYAQVETPDEVTANFQLRSDRWRLTVGQSHDQVAEQIRADGIDILIDLAGHTLNNRLPVLARKPAPIQITWLGYPNTTGVSTIDYRFTDWHADPKGAEDYYTEKLIRLPDAFFVYQPPEPSPPVSPLPMLKAGHVTFGSFNNIIKITPAVAQLWVELMRHIPNSRLLIGGIPTSAQDRLRQLLNGISADRIEMRETVTITEYLHLHDRVDIGLDPFPWAGHTTTCHSLWMGVPVISRAGPTAVSRAGVSIMANLGLEAECIARSPEDYVRLAKDWANRPDDLSKLRGELRGRLLKSPLTDAERFTRNFEKQLRQLWQSAASVADPATKANPQRAG